MTIIQTANTLGLKVRTIRSWISMGKIKAVKKGRVWDIPDEEVTRKEIIENAYKGRKYSRRTEKSA